MSTSTLTCITRRRHARGFSYYSEDGQKVTDKRELERIKKLVIPPMWEEVEICLDPKGKVQATGRDLKGRKQYIYHPTWEQQRQAEKFQRLTSFAKKLPIFRKKCQKLVEQNGYAREKILALMVLILDDTGMRIGNNSYTSQNGTYGLSNLRQKHLDAKKKELVFQYQGKSKKQRKVLIDDPDLVKFIKRSAEQPGYEIFRYKDDDGQWNNVDSDELNEFIHNDMGEDFSSKFFRTWVACRLTVELYPEAKAISEKSKRKKLAPTLVKLVAKELGNTPAVCREYYIHPTLLDQVESASLPTLDFNKLNDVETDKTVLKLIGN
jgi:DNA topoisomerase-1